MQSWSAIESLIAANTGREFRVHKSRGLAGGSINDAYLIADKDRQYFVKFNHAEKLDMFAAEAEGLIELSKPGVIRIPEVIGYDHFRHQSYLVLEYISLGRSSSESDRRMGQQLAALHHTEAKRFGWRRDNTIGATPQINTWCDSWPEFLARNRIGYQLELATRNGFGRGITNGATLCANLHVFFSNYEPRPALLHGDLWSGNYAYSNEGEPIIYDPAVYFGDRESDLAMTELFGGFSPDFYASYQEHYPLDEGYRVRKTLYKLYHILNHLNLFGSGYLAQSKNMIDSLLAQIR